MQTSLDFDLDCLVKNKVLKKGSDISRVYGDSRYVLAAWDKPEEWMDFRIYVDQDKHPTRYRGEDIYLSAQAANYVWKAGGC